MKIALKAAHAAGFDLIELWKSKLLDYLQDNSVHDLIRLLEESSLEPWSINSIEHITFRTPEDYSAIKDECEKLAAIAEILARHPRIWVFADEQDNWSVGGLVGTAPRGWPRL